MKTDNGYKAFNKHFPKTIGKDIRDYVTDDVLLYSRYMFIRRVKGIQFGYCTHCKKSHMTVQKLKHKERTVCPECQSSCIVKNHGTSRKYMTDRAYIVYYEKSKINDQAIIARGFYVYRDYSGDYTNVETQYINNVKYVFEPGQARMFESYYWRKDDHWVPQRSVYSMQCQSSYAINRCCVESIRAAVEGTPYQYSKWESYAQPQFDYVKFFALFSRYPVIEYLEKLGFGAFVEAKLFDDKTFNCIRWSGRTMEEVLRLSKQDIKILRDCKEAITPYQIRLYQLSRPDANRPTLSEILSWKGAVNDQMETIKRLLPYANLRKIMNYTHKQINRPEKEKYTRVNEVLTAWRDYLHECKQLDFDLNHERTVFPSNLFASHQKIMKMIVHQKNELIDRKIAGRAAALKTYCFEQEGLMIRPAKSATELIEEGKQLSICVGSYVDRYAAGQTGILFIRKQGALDQPFYCLELRGEQVVQVQGFKHCDPTPDVQEFIKTFKAARLRNKKTEVAG